jgi:ribosomal protein S18 acetylase RimI-like enzyme
MAARSGILSDGLEIVDLRRLSGRELEPLLLEETVEWRRDLDWDFAKSAELVSHFTDAKALIGFALLDRAEIAGYGYSVLEDQKGLIGDFYVRRDWRDNDTDVWLLRNMFDGLMAMERLRRVESQLLLMSPEVGREIQKERDLQYYERLMMSLNLEAAAAIPLRAPRKRFHLEPWADHLQDSAATVISLAYKGHVDSRINDQYGTIGGSRRFVANIVQFPGCGVFYRPGSMLAFNPATGWLAGVVLVTFVAPEVGHITQLCVTPDAQGTGLGYDLLSRAIFALQAGGAKRVTLTVTEANTGAVELYRKFGFREIRRFSALVWDAP